MTSVRVPGFAPSASAFHFANSFPHVPLREFNLSGIATLSIGDAANGLCGGMSYTAVDLFTAGVASPPDTSPPPEGTPAFDFLVQRQIDSFDDGVAPLRFFELMAPSRPDREPSWGDVVGAVGVDAHSRTHVMIDEEWPGIREDLDNASLCPLGLVRVVSADPTLLGRNHQVVAFGYDLDGTALSLRIYDPNWPNDDTVTLSLDVGDPGGSVTPVYSKPDAPVLCFFRTAYAPRDPTPWRVAPTTPTIRST